MGRRKQKWVLDGGKTPHRQLDKALCSQGLRFSTGSTRAREKVMPQVTFLSALPFQSCKNYMG